MSVHSRYAVIADVHGNSLALAAVVRDWESRGVSLAINLGDNVNGPFEPRAALRMLRDKVAWHVRGNGDRMTGLGGPGISRSAQYVRKQLSAEELSWLGAQPATVQSDGWFACHGTPKSDEDYLLEKVEPLGVRPRPLDDVATQLDGVEPELILCGHTHLPRLERLPDGRHVVNPGSVGLQAYTDSTPFPHRMETGSPHARYAIVTRRLAGWDVEFLAIAYDWESAAREAEAAGFSDWVRPLRAGFA
jgi:predicted phosphodiesterase